MFVDARQIESGATMETDLCIIGAGAAGIVLAREFLGTGTEICLVESGDLQFSWDVQALSEITESGLHYFARDCYQLRYFGGNTNAWGGWCRPLDPIDFQKRSWVPDSGWPFDRSELDPWYPRAEAICGVDPMEEDAAAWVARLSSPRARLLPVDPSLLRHTVFQFSKALRFGQVYQDEIRASDTVRCLLNAHVLGLRASADARYLTHIDVGTLSGKRFKVHARRFVLATGAIENARLLLLSTDVVPAGLGNTHDLVGRYFMEHPHVRRPMTPIDQRAPIGLYGLAFYRNAVSVRLSLREEVQERLGLLGYSANLHQIYYGHDTPGWAAFFKLMLTSSSLRSTDPFVRFSPIGPAKMSRKEIFDIIRQFPQVTVAALLQKFQPAGFVGSYVLESKPEAAPNRDSRVVLDESCDSLGLPRARLEWRTLECDRRTALLGDEIVGRELERLGIAILTPLPPAEAVPTGPWPSNLAGGWHQIGTTRMHEDPHHGVVDANCLVHGMENLYIAGCSVFPTQGTAPPTVTVIALALRLAAHLKATAVPSALRSRGTAKELAVSE